ncbi:GspH/FimT family pseudopilin [Roseateles sp. BYS180W]|uniref:Type II secretion system protein H n=1 Tax=Roseateles rivi TaxID=3299028 RepID=A0ABW7FXX2_9BURK
MHRPHPRCETARTPRGLTLIELCTTLAVLLALLSAATPWFADLLAAQRLKSASRNLVADLQLARSEALLGSKTVRLQLQDIPGGRCYVLHTGAQQACQCTQQREAICDSGAQLIATRMFEHKPGRPTLTSNVQQLLFSGQHGTVSSTGTLELSLSEQARIRHVVSLMGRVRACSPGTPALGFPVCA